MSRLFGYLYLVISRNNSRVLAIINRCIWGFLTLSDLSVHASRQGKLIIPQPGDESTTQLPSFQGGGMDWIKTCNDLQTALVSSCDVLVNPVNILTTEGERAVGCIHNGIALAGGGNLVKFAAPARNYCTPNP